MSDANRLHNFPLEPIVVNLASQMRCPLKTLLLVGGLMSLWFSLGAAVTAALLYPPFTPLAVLILLTAMSLHVVVLTVLLTATTPSPQDLLPIPVRAVPSVQEDTQTQDVVSLVDRAFLLGQGAAAVTNPFMDAADHSAPRLPSRCHPAD